MAHKQMLVEDAETCRRKMTNAMALIEGLGGEKVEFLIPLLDANRFHDHFAYLDSMGNCRKKISGSNQSVGGRCSPGNRISFLFRSIQPGFPLTPDFSVEKRDDGQ